MSHLLQKNSRDCAMLGENRKSSTVSKFPGCVTFDVKIKDHVQDVQDGKSQKTPALKIHKGEGKWENK